MSALLLPAALTLALLAGLALLARRARSVLGKREGLRGLEVLDRVPLGPKQGVAAIRMAGRVVVVGHGDGGVRHLAELTETEWRRGGVTDAIGEGGAIRPRPATLESAEDAVNKRRPVAPRLRRFLLLAGVAATWGAGPLDAGVPAPREAAAPGSLFAAPDLTTAPTLLAAPALIAAQQENEPSPAADEQTSGGLLQALPPLAARGDDPEAPLELTGPVGTALLLGVMALLPTLLLLATGFTRILIVLHLLKQALGAQAVPPVHLVNALALLLTLFLMGPTLDRASQEAIHPWLDGEIAQVEMFERVAVPFRDFMLEYANEEDVARFVDLRGGEIPASIEEVRFTTLMAAFTTSELKRAFQLGFVLFLPFIVIDLVVASVLMSMGMFMLPPVMISLPFKLLLFVLADGWGLVVGGLLSSFG